MSAGDYVSEKDVELLAGRLEGLTSAVEKGATWTEVEDDVWDLYVKAEMMVTLMKLRLGVERPGRFITIVEKQPLTEHIGLAFGSIKRARESLEAKDYPKTLENLRECRNDLRGFLEASRKLRLKAVRAKRAETASVANPVPSSQQPPS